MEDANASSRVEESIQQQQQQQESVPAMQVESISQRLEALENSVRYLENTMMTRLSTLEGRVEELVRRMDGFSDRWSRQVITELSTVLPDVPPSTALPLRHKKRQGSLTVRRVKRRYQRLVQSSWDDQSPLRHIRRLERKRRQRT